MKWRIFQAYFSNSARLIGRCAHGSFLARGRSSVRTTYFPVWLGSIIVKQDHQSAFSAKVDPCQPCRTKLEKIVEFYQSNATQIKNRYLPCQVLKYRHCSLHLAWAPQYVQTFHLRNRKNSFIFLVHSIG